MAWPFAVVAQSENDPLETEFERLMESAKDLRLKGEYDMAYTVLDSAYDLSQGLGQEALIADAASQIGVIKMYQGAYSDALKKLHEGLIIRENIKDSVGMAASYNYIASVHHAQTDYEIAIDYYGKTQVIQEKLIADSVLFNVRLLGITYNNMGSLYADLGTYNKAINYLDKSLEIWEQVQDSTWIPIVLRHRGVCYQNEGRLDDALETFLIGYQMSKEVGTRMNVIRASMPIGELYLELGKPDKALRWCEEAHTLSLEENNLYGIKESCWCLSEIYEGLDRHDEALEFYKLSIEARDSIFGHERTKELTRLEMGFKFDREQLADSLEYVRNTLIQESKITNQRLGLVSVGTITAILFALALAIYYGKRKSDSLLLNILPAKVADELKVDGSSKARRLDNVTVLFTDFKGFTQMSETLSPEDLVAEIHHCFSAFDRIMGDYGVEKIKTIGDAYMAGSGVPEPSETHAEDVINAAIAIRDFMVKRKNELEQEGRLGFEMRIGIHTGTVVAGIVGKKKFQYDIWGDAVNTAARMESSGETNKVNVSDATYSLVKDKFSFIPRGKVKAKGKGELEMYFAEPLA